MTYRTARTFLQNKRHRNSASELVSVALVRGMGVTRRSEARADAKACAKPKGRPRAQRPEQPVPDNGFEDAAANNPSPAPSNPQPKKAKLLEQPATAAPHVQAPVPDAPQPAPKRAPKRRKRTDDVGAEPASASAPPAEPASASAQPVSLASAPAALPGRKRKNNAAQAKANSAPPPIQPDLAPQPIQPDLAPQPNAQPEPKAGAKKRARPLRPLIGHMLGLVFSPQFCIDVRPGR